MALVSKNLNIKNIGSADFYADVRLARLSRTAFFSLNIKNADVSDAESKDFIGVTIPVIGRFLADRKRKVSFEPGTAHVLNINDPFYLLFPHSPDIMVANFYKPLLEEFASKLLYEGNRLNFSFKRRLNLSTPAGNSFWRYLSFNWTELGREDCLLKSSMVTKEIEDSLYAMFVYASVDACCLLQSRHNDGSLVGHARRAEAYIMENLSESISAAEIAHAAKISYPTLYRAFIKYKNTSPMQFVRQQRLEAVHRELMAAEYNQIRVTDIAMQYGFYNLG
jgi:AraC-like DNA-binding protein